jgi:hypothetical protein
MLELFGYIMILLFLFYLLAYLVEHYMMRMVYLILACLSSISKKYGLSETTAGYILAFGSSIPEFTTNIIASNDMNKKNLVLGLGTISASGSFGKTNLFIFRFFNVSGHCVVLHR